jgi:hypothetical protein
MRVAVDVRLALALTGAKRPRYDSIGTLRAASQREQAGAGKNQTYESCNVSAHARPLCECVSAVSLREARLRKPKELPFFEKLKEFLTRPRVSVELTLVPDET